MNRILLTVACFIFTICASAQKKIIVQGNYPDLYIIHKVSAKETLTNIGKLYSLSATAIEKTNNLSDAGILTIGKEIKISLSKNNFTQDGQCAEGEVLVPLYHIVQKGENLFRISQVFGRVRIDFLREWNDLNSDIIQPAQKIIIGHLKVPKGRASDAIDASVQAGDTDNGYEVKDDNTATATTTKKDPEKKPVEPTVANNDDDGEGYFVVQYPSDVKGKQHFAKNGEAATFKTTSGWSDKKYYVLMNDVTPGTIIRITSSNNKSICAKVLGALPDMKENVSLLVRMSNAAASALRVTDAKFQVQISYYR